MNDDFLKNYKKQPRPEFARSLRLKLLQQGDIRMKPVVPIFRYAIAALLIAVLTVAAVPSARAQASEAIRYIILSSGVIPVSNYQPIEVEPSQDSTIGTASKIDVQTMSLADAQAQFVAIIPLPEAPNGYVLDKENVEVTFVDNKAYQLHMRWSNGESQIELYATVDAQQDEPQAVTQPSGDAVTGATTSDLMDWVQDGVRYTLIGNISADEMSKMAASLQ